MGNEKIAKRLCRKWFGRWIYSVNGYLKEGDLDLGQARRMVFEKNEWQGVIGT